MYLCRNIMRKRIITSLLVFFVNFKTQTQYKILSCEDFGKVWRYCCIELIQSYEGFKAYPNSSRMGVRRCDTLLRGLVEWALSSDAKLRTLVECLKLVDQTILLVNFK